MTEEDYKKRIIELELAAKEGLETIEWFEGWLTGREEPVRYDPAGCAQHPPVFTVNYASKDVAEVRAFIEAVLNNEPIEDN